MNREKKSFWKSYHRWAGIIITVFILLFCISGIILNHREAFINCNIDRKWLPESYRIANFNNASIKGTLPIDSIRVLAFGNTGIWLTDRNFDNFVDFNSGLPEGMDGRTIRNIIMGPDSTLWCATQYHLFHHNGEKWLKIPLAGNNERISDLTQTHDRTRLVILTRSAVYTLPFSSPSAKADCVYLNAPANFNPKVSLFKTFWQIHSGELFGLTGRIFVDIIAVIMIVLCITGLIIFILPYTIRKAGHSSHRSMVKHEASSLKWNHKWHNRIGYFTVIFTILLAFTGMCLRPPFMIPLVMVKTSPVPGSKLDSANAWHDKLRGIRWDSATGTWLISTSEGFIRINEVFSGKPQLFTSQTVPPVSPMGITVFEEIAPGKWIIGSFSGLFEWDTVEGTVNDLISGAPYKSAQRSRFTSTSLVSGYSTDLATKKPVIFTYSTGASETLPQSPLLESQPISLWNAALELHVGRCYAPFLGPLSELFVFLSGLLITLILLSGYLISSYHKRKEKTKI